MTLTSPPFPRAGVFVYAKDLERVAGFYEALGGLVRRSADANGVELASADLQLMVHAIPAPIADGIEIGTPPQRREDVALKFFFTVDSLDDARATAARLGGEVFHENWPGPGYLVCNAIDPEGNVFQLRQATPSP